MVLAVVSMNTQVFFQDLAVILVAAGLVAAVCTRLGWPKVFGYITAGVVLGKHTFGGSFVIDQSSIEVLGEVGIVFLMLTLGLEFNVRKLRKVGRVVFPTALLDMAVMIWAGHLVGTKVLGWGTVQSLFLGAAISDSATTLLAKTLSDMGWGSRRFAKYIFGITISEDVLCIGVIALLGGLASTGAMRLGQAAVSMGGLLLFLVGVLVFGLLLVPRVLDRVARLTDDESLLLAALGVCFLVSFLAAKLEYSLPLGAFLVGVMVAESGALKRIYQQCLPLRILFSAIFFVTIGLRVDPAQMVGQAAAIAGLTALVVVGKSVNCTFGALLSGLDLKNALQTGLGLAQIGEFAYLVALLGVTTGAADRSLYQLAVGVSLLTTVLNPFLLRASDPFADWVARRLPERWREGLSTYANWTERYAHSVAPNATVRAVRLNLLLVALQMVLAAVIFIAAGMLARLDYSGFSAAAEANKKTLLWSGACLLTVPVAVLLDSRARLLGEAVADSLIPIKLAKTSWAVSFRSMARWLFGCAGVAAIFFESVMLSGSILPEQGWARALVVGTLLLLGVFGWRRFRAVGSASVEALRDVLAKEVETDPADSSAELLDIHVGRIVVEAGSGCIGRSLKDVGLRARTGASVIGIERDGRTAVNPTAETALESGDLLLLLGDDEQIAAAGALLRRRVDDGPGEIKS